MFGVLNSSENEVDTDRVLLLADYTLIHYDVNAWEGLVYQYGLESLRQAGCNVDGLVFDPEMVIRGLIIDKERGNLVKVDRFGWAKHQRTSIPVAPLLLWWPGLPILLMCGHSSPSHCRAALADTTTALD